MREGGIFFLEISREDRWLPRRTHFEIIWRINSQEFEEISSNLNMNASSTEMLSRWVRERTRDVSDFDSLDESLGHFVQERKFEIEVNQRKDGGSSAGYTERELAKLQSGSGLNRNRDSDVLESTADASQTSKKRSREVCMFFSYAFSSNQYESPSYSSLFKIIPFIIVHAVHIMYH